MSEAIAHGSGRNIIARELPSPARLIRGWSGHPYLMIQEIDAALESNAGLTSEQVAEVKALRDQGEAEHEAGKHAESVETLQKAKDILGLQ